jgi:DNA-binding HxlR family transcriptional regulator
VARQSSAVTARGDSMSASPAAAAATPTKLKASSSQKTVGELDRVIHERIRLGVVSALAVNQALSFSDLKELLAVTDGNLSVHTRKLEEAGYVECTKTFEGRIPRTEYRLTGPGRLALEKYLAHMESLIQATRGGK